MTRSTVDGRPHLSEPRNHFEMVKNMSMEQMAEFIAKFHGCSHCPGFNVPCDNRCQEYWLDWLKEEIADV